MGSIAFAGTERGLSLGCGKYGAWGTATLSCFCSVQGWKCLSALGGQGDAQVMFAPPQQVGLANRFQSFANFVLYY